MENIEKREKLSMLKYAFEEEVFKQFAKEVVYEGLEKIFNEYSRIKRKKDSILYGTHLT